MVKIIRCKRFRSKVGNLQLNSPDYEFRKEFFLSQKNFVQTKDLNPLIKFLEIIQIMRQ